MSDISKYIIVKCPKCGYEYIASEIFYPEDILGKVKNVVRDDSGKIIFIEGDYPELIEEWQCDKCDTNFKVKLSITSEIIYDKNLDFSEDFIIDLEDKDKEKLF